jgi:hypothetical protein
MGVISPDKPAASCAECFAWGVLPGRCCRACYTFRNLHPAGRCAACHRIVAVKAGYCRLCRLQALDDAKAAGEPAVSEPFLRRVRCQQLFLARMHRDHYRRPGRALLGKQGRRGQRGQPVAPGQPHPSPAGVQLRLPIDVRRDYSRFDRARHADPTHPTLLRAQRVARGLGEARGWSRWLAGEVDRALVILLSSHVDGDQVRFSELFPVLQGKGLGVERTVEILDQLGVFDDDRVPAFESWLQRKLDGLAAGIRRDTEGWIRALHDGGPRTRARDPNTVSGYLNELRPVLLGWSQRYDHLREVTRDDILTIVDARHGTKRRHTLSVLRSLFRHCKKSGALFRDPTARIRVGPNAYGVILPLSPEQIAKAVSAATTPASRLALILAAVHAARSKDIGELRLTDLDLGRRQLIIAGRARPLDDLTHQALLDWLDHRRERWPDTANPHLLINRLTAVKTSPVSRVWITRPFWGLDATLERLHADRQLEELLVHGPDPLHLAAVFGLHPNTAIRYANAARQLQATAAEQYDPPSSPRTQGVTPGPGPE